MLMETAMSVVTKYIAFSRAEVQLERTNRLNLHCHFLLRKLQKVRVCYKPEDVSYRVKRYRGMELVLT